MRFAWFVLPFLLAAGVSAPAAAQERTEAQRRATARALFGEGVSFADGEQWAEAADRFRRTMDLHPTPVVAFNLASALIELGRLVEGAEHLHMAQRFPGAEITVIEEAQLVLDEIEPRIGRLRVVVDVMPEGAHVERDRNVLTRAEINVAVPTDPGRHVVRLVREGETLDEQSVDIAPGGSEMVRMGVDLSPEAVAGAAGDTETGSEDGEETGGGGSVAEEWWFWTIIGVLVVGAAVGIGVGVAASDGGQGGDPVPGDLDPPILRGMVFP